MAGEKRYVVWQGLQTWIFTSRGAVQPLVSGVKGAKYKSFSTEKDAREASEKGWEIYYQPEKKWNEKQLPFVKKSIAVDSACSSATGIMEYQGMDLVSGQLIFRFKHPKGTNNIWEFLALVHGLAYLKEKKSDYALYSDSKIAINRVLEKRCKTNYTLDAQSELFLLVKRAEQWLANNSTTTQILKRNTQERWEIPADFGRK